MSSNCVHSVQSGRETWSFCCVSSEYSAKQSEQRSACGDILCILSSSGLRVMSINEWKCVWESGMQKVSIADSHTFSMRGASDSAVQLSWGADCKLAAPCGRSNLVAAVFVKSSNVSGLDCVNIINIQTSHCVAIARMPQQNIQHLRVHQLAYGVWIMVVISRTVLRIYRLQIGLEQRKQQKLSLDMLHQSMDIFEAESRANWGQLSSLSLSAGQGALIAIPHKTSASSESAPAHQSDVCFGAKIIKLSKDWTVEGSFLVTNLHKHPIAAIALSPNGRFLASCSSTGTIISLSDLSKSSSGRHLFRRGLERATVSSLAFSCDGAWLMVASDTGTVHAFDCKRVRRNPSSVFDSLRGSQIYHSIAKSISDHPGEGNIAFVCSKSCNASEFYVVRQGGSFGTIRMMELSQRHHDMSSEVRGDNIAIEILEVHDMLSQLTDARVM